MRPVPDGRNVVLILRRPTVSRVMAGLVAKDVVVRFGGLVALDGVSVEAPPGRITGLIGPNGAGKTTMFNVCCGFQPADEGTVTLDGVDITKESPARRARLGIGRTFQRMELFRLPDRAGERRAGGRVAPRRPTIPSPSSALVRRGPQGAGRGGRDGGRGCSPPSASRRWPDQLAGEVSTGQGRLVELARALARRPRILLLDEPSSGPRRGRERGLRAAAAPGWWRSGVSAS